MSSAGGNANIVAQALTFIVEAKRDFTSDAMVCTVSFFDNDHIQVDSPTTVGFDPLVFSWTEGTRSHGMIILPAHMSRVREITVRC